MVSLNCEVHSSFEGVSYNNRIVTAKIYLSLCRNKRETIKTSSNDWSSLTNRDISHGYTVTVRNKFDTLRRCPRGVMVKMMDCEIVVSELELQLHYYVHFQTNTLGKGMNPLILPAMG